MRRARLLYRHRQASGHARRILSESAAPELRNRKHSGFVKTAGNNLHAVAKTYPSMKETRQVWAVGTEPL